MVVVPVKDWTDQELAGILLLDWHIVDPLTATAHYVSPAAARDEAHARGGSLDSISVLGCRQSPLGLRSVFPPQCDESEVFCSRSS